MTSKRTKRRQKEEDSNKNASSDPNVICGAHISVLEAFDNLNWDDDIPPERRASLKRSFLPLEEEIEPHAIKLINSKFVKFPTKEIYIPQKIENGDMKMPVYLPGLEPTYQICFPKYSVINQKDQTRLYEFILQMSLNKPLRLGDVAAFQFLRAKVAEEYAEFQEFAMSQWCTSHWKRALEIHPEVERYFETWWKTRADECLSLYPEEYTQVSQVALALNDPNADFSVMKFVKGVHVQSAPLKLFFPKVKKKIGLITGFQELGRIKPVSGDTTNNPKPFLKPIPSVSCDRQVDYLVRKSDLNVDVVISMSGIKTLIDNINFQREWILPITVKNIVKDTGEMKKVVIIDKHLPPKCLSVHDINVWHAKMVAKWMLVRAECPELFDEVEETPHSKSKESYNDLLNGVAKKLSEKKDTELSLSEGGRNHKPSLPSPDQQTASGISAVEKFAETATENTKTNQPTQRPGVSSKSRHLWTNCNKPKSGRSQENDPDKWKCERQDLISYDDPFSDCAVEENEDFGVDPCLPHVKTQRIWHKEKGGKTDPEKNSVKKRHWIDIPSDFNMEDGEIFDPFIKPECLRRISKWPCLEYQMWNLQKSRVIPFLKLEQRSLNILVRTRKDGVLADYKGGKRSMGDICTSSKLELQPDYGATTMTASELIREYLDLFLRPNSKLVRVRSVGHTQEVMLTEVKTLPQVRDALKVEIQKMQELFDPLYAVLTKLVDLPPGQYLLQHTAKMGPFATLLQNKPGGTAFNLTQYCNELTRVEVSVPPRPIDPLVLTALQKRDRTPAALFQPLRGVQEAGKGFFSKPKVTEQQKNKWKKQKKRVKNYNNKKKRSAAIIMKETFESGVFQPSQPVIM